MKHVGIEIKFYNLDTFKKQIDVNFIDLDNNLVDLNYKVASLIFCHFWRSIESSSFGKNYFSFHYLRLRLATALFFVNFCLMR